MSDAFAPAGRRALVISLGSTLLLLLALWIGASGLLVLIQVSRFHWLDTAIDVAGSLATLVVAWLFFPAMSILVLGIFLNGFVAAIEQLHYPELPPARNVGLIETLRSVLGLTFVALVLNLVLLPLYFLPIVNLPVYYALNGYLIGRAYFEQVALRRMNLPAARSLWHQRRAYLSVAGAIWAAAGSVDTCLS